MCERTECLPQTLIFWYFKIWILHGSNHFDLKIASSAAKIDANFANNFLKNRAKNKCDKVLNCFCLGYKKSIIELVW